MYRDTLTPDRWKKQVANSLRLGGLMATAQTSPLTPARAMQEYYTGFFIEDTPLGRRRLMKDMVLATVSKHAYGGSGDGIKD